MKNIYFNSELNNKACYFFLQLFFLFGMIVTANAQLRVPFTQRTSQYTPDKKIYNIKGDYAMIGNTNMTLQNYADNTQNGNNNMVYTDIDSDSNTFNSSSSNLTFSSENGAIPSCSNIIYAGLYWTGRASKTSPSNNTFTVTKNSVTKTFDKRIISLKGPNSSTYTQITAASSDIYYPTTSDGFMYSAYAEVTDYVRNNGLGTYFAADIALIEGNDDTGTGYYGGWSLIVIYENNKMKYRDVTIFDGHAYVAGNVTADFEIPVSGFNTVQSGQVNMKLGLMAGEGDRGISGDYFQVRDHTNANWITLNHSGNSTTNFFNSSIQTGGNTRNPNLLNNTGLDIGVFNIPNSGNSVITNNQTSTRFKYGTTQDTFVIFAIVMSVDAYIPQVEALITAATINGSPAVQPYTILPGQEAGYSVDIKNLGTEAVNNYKIIVPIPYNATYVAGSASGTIFSPQTTPTPNSITFNPSLGATGSIVWDFGTLILPANPSSLLARLTFRLRSTTDCAILSNATCSSNMSVVGNSTGIGAITNVALNNSNFIQGYNQNGTCVGEPIPTPITIAINGTNYVTQNCPNTSTIRNFSYCSASTSVGTSLIASNFPPGSKFYNSFPVTTSSIQYTDANPIPLVSGSTITYYAVPSGGGSGCNFPFTITKCPVIVAQNDALAGGNGTTLNPNIGNVLSNNGSGSDTLNGVQALISQVNITVTTPATPINGNPVPILDPFTGQVSVPAGTPAGTYTIVYNLCEKLNPLANCDPATVNIIVTTPAIVAVNNTYTNINCTTSGLIGNVLANDTLNGAPFASNLVTFTLLTGSNPTISFSSNGDVNITSGIAAGVYTFTYKICQVLNPTNCSNIATISITVVDTTAPVISTLPGISTISCPATPSFTIPTVSDTCGSATLTSNDVRTNGACVNSYSITRTWTATDASGNTATASQTIIVQDTTAPTWTTTANALNTTLQCSDAAGLASAQALAPTATDNCGGTVTYTKTSGIFTAGSCPNYGTYTNTWIAKDVCNNSSTSFTQVITIQDTTSPTWSTTGASLNATIECSDATAIAAAQAQFPVAADNCDSDVTNIVKNAGQFVASEECVNAGTYTNTWTVTDACNNTSAVFTQVITIQDTIAPTWSTTAASLNATIECSDATAIAAAQALFPSATDNCDSDVTNIVKNAGQFVASSSCNNAGTYTNTWTVTDACGNTSEVFTQTINIIDNTAPTWTTAAASLNATIECSDATAIAAAQAQLPVAADNCDSDVTNIVKTAGQFVASEECPNAGTYTNTWTVTDDCNNTSEAFTQVINIQDTTAPTWSTTAASLNTTIECSNATAIAAAQAQFPVAADNCDSDVTNIVKTAGQFVASEECANAGTYTNTWTVTDACNNTSEVFTQTINIIDTTAPSWSTTSASLNTTIECSNATAIAAAQAQFPVAADNCDSDVTNIVKNAGQFVTSEECPNAGTYTNTWTITDACGNTSKVFTQVITIQDTTVPTWSTTAASLNATIECSDATAIAAAQALFPSATDNCDSDVTNIVKIAGDFVASSTCANAGTYTNTWTVTDACGNTSEEFTQVITIQDTTSPTWLTTAASLNATIECSDATAIAAAQAQFPSATDNCDIDVTNIVKTAGQFVASEECPNTGTYTNTWTVTDACNNTSAVFTQVITIQDTTAPTWTTAAASLDATIECSDATAIAAAQAQFPVAADNCDSDVTNIVKNAGQFVASEECANAGTYTNTWTVTDACNNTSQVFTQVITIQDTTSPTWSTTAGSLNTTIECSNATSIAAAQAQFPVATDNCDSDVANIVKTAGQFVASSTCANAGTYTNTWSVTDACGNTSEVFTQVITIQDTTSPTWSTAANSLNQTVECNDATAIATAQAQFPVAADNCDSDVTNIVKTAGQFVASSSCANAGTYTNTWTVTDACNNTSAVFTQVITVQDTTAPTWSTTAASLNTTIECSDAIAIVAAQAQFPVAADNCDSNVTNIVKNAGQFVASEECPNAGTYTNTWTVTDDCGNISEVFTQVITIQDTTAPTWTTAAASLDAIIECSDATAIAAAQAQFPVAADNCDSDVTNIVKNAGQFVASEKCKNAGTYTNTWTATDACNNTSAVFTQVITIQDTTAPIIDIQATNATVECDGNGNAEALAAWLASNGGASASDACSEVTWSNNFTALSDLCGNTGSATVTFTATDDCGNSSTTSGTFTIQDTLAPESTTEYDLKIQVTCSTIPEAPQLVFNDNCSGNVTPVFTQTQSETLDNMFTIIRTWIATDSCGNISQTYTQTIQVTVTSDVISLPSVQTSNNIDENISLDALLPSGVTGGTWANVNNAAGFDTINNTFNPLEIAPGDYLFSYTINDGSCLVRYDLLIIVGQVNPCELIIIHNAFTPNGDNFNEWFQIENIEDFNCYPSNTVEIYNRWGVLVYNTKNYDNVGRRFEGISEGRTTVKKSDELPTGTYFYLIQWTTTDGQTVTKDGYLYLTR